MKVIKRDGHMVEYSPEKIENAILKANNDVDESERVSPVQIRNIIKYIEGLGKKRILVEDIQDIIEIKLMSIGKFTLAKKYITYRYTRELVRRSNTTDVAVKNLIDGDNEHWDNQNINKNAKLVTVQRDYLAGITSTDITRRFLLPEDIVKAHDDGILYFHNMDYFAQNALYNSSIINLADMLLNGCNIDGVTIERPVDFKEAVSVTNQIVASVIASQYGSVTLSLSHLAPFVVESYKKYLKKYQIRNLTKELASIYATEDLKEEIIFGIKMLIQGLNTLMVGNSSSINLFMYLKESKQYKQELALLIEEVFKQYINGVKCENGGNSLILRPKLIYVLEEDNIGDKGKYYYLTELAANCVSKSINPDFVSEKKLIEFNNMDNNNLVNYGSFNQGVVTLNLVDVALSSDKDLDAFWQILEERLELCHKALQIRHKRLSKVTADSAPILWRYGAISRLNKDESIHDLLHGSYSTLSLGFVGLYECVKFMKGKTFHDDEDSEGFASKILDRMNIKCKRWNDAEKINYVLYGTTDEIVCEKFASCLKDRFGEIKGITDKNYITSSYQIPSSVKLEMYQKLSVESKMQKLVYGGSFVSLEIGNVKANDKKLIELLDYLYENILYIQISTKIDSCLRCGYVGRMRINDELNWQCPKCKNQDEDKMKIFRKLYGNIEKDNWSISRKEELKYQMVYLEEVEGEVYEY